MSATGRGAERAEYDSYHTPDALALTLTRRLAADFCLQPRTVLEPSVGGGAFVRAVRSVWGERPYVAGVDIQDVPGCGADGVTRCDFLAHPPVEPGLARRPGLIIGNPPFCEAEPHTRHALSFRPPGGVVAFLLRLAFLESKARVPFWQENRPARVYVLSERPSFTGGGTDSCAYGFFVWQEGHSGATAMDWVYSWKGAE